MTRLGIAACLLGIAALPGAACAETILFVGNSFTAGAGSEVEHFQPGTVTDLNREGVGGVPALFEAFARQSGLPYEVHLEVAGGMNLDFHYEQKAALISSRERMLREPVGGEREVVVARPRPASAWLVDVRPTRRCRACSTA